MSHCLFGQDVSLNLEGQITYIFNLLTN